MPAASGVRTVKLFRSTSHRDVSLRRPIQELFHPVKQQAAHSPLARIDLCAILDLLSGEPYSEDLC